MRSIVLPGDQIDGGAERSRNTYRSGDASFSKVLGIYDESRGDVVPLEGPWMPAANDSVVGTISDVKSKLYIVDIQYFGRALLIPGKYDTYEFAAGDVLSAMVKDVEGRNTVILSDPQQLSGGVLVKVKPKKIPRIIGKKSTMVSQIAEATDTRIVVGMNGLIWISGRNVALAIEAIMKVQNEAHTSGLTNSIRDFLISRK